MFKNYDPTTLKVGDTAFISAAHGDRVSKGKVTKVTATGQITVERPTHNGSMRLTRFDNKGREFGASSRWYCEHLIDEDAYNGRIGATVQRKRIAAAWNAADELAKMFGRDGCDKQAVLEKIEALKALAEAI
jgi:hypothetical protein